MKLNVTAELVGFDGEVVQEKYGTGDNGTMRPLTLRAACTTALMAGNPKDNVDGAEKLRRFALARKIHDEDNPSIQVEDVTLIKKLIGEMFLPNVVGPVWILFEGEEEPRNVPS